MRSSGGEVEPLHREARCGQACHFSNPTEQSEADYLMRFRRECSLCMRRAPASSQVHLLRAALPRDVRGCGGR